MGNLLESLGRIGSMLGTPERPNADTVALRVAWQTFDIVWPILTVLAGLGVLLAVWLGVRLATAQDESKRKEAKAQLVWALIAVVLVISIIVIFRVILAAVGGVRPGDIPGATG